MSQEFDSAKFLKGTGYYLLSIFTAALVYALTVDWLNYSTIPDDLKYIGATGVLLIGLAILFKSTILQVITPRKRPNYR